jgi:hypothetical protein
MAAPVDVRTAPEEIIDGYAFDRPAADGVIELRQQPAELSARLVEAVERGDSVDAFLFAAGLRQIAEDHLEPDRLRLGDVEALLASSGHRFAAALVRGLARLLGAARLPRRRMRAWDERLGRLVDELADCSMTGATPGADLIGNARALVADLPRSRAFRAAVMRVPASLHSFDQHPDDIRRLVDELAGRSADRGQPVAVVGIRTSGSYLAPLTAAELRARGYAGAAAVTARPSCPLSRRKRRAIRALEREGGLALVTDDPPVSGTSIARVATALERLGLGRDSIVIAYATMAGAPSCPPALVDHARLVLPWERWSVHERLGEAATARNLGRLWPGVLIQQVERVEIADLPSRGHCSARHRVTLTDADGTARVVDVYVRGAGLGYLGEHACTVQRRIASWVPEPYGVVDGLLYRRWLPEEQRLIGAASRPAADIAAGVAAYATERRRALAVSGDRTLRIPGQLPVWEAASEIASLAFARGSRAMRVAATDVALRKLLAAREPSVVDGAMAPSNWFVDDATGSLLKVKAHERSHSNRELACSDAAYDVAAAAALGVADEDALRVEFARQSGEWVDEERWLLYKLVALWSARRDRALEPEATARAQARALQVYFAALYFRDLAAAAGPFCALDVDGVLETQTLGFPGLSPASALALRSLRAHGYRPLLVTGRALDEVAERCDAYGLVGAVAEYGAAIHAGGRSDSLLPPHAQAALDAARAALAATAGVSVEATRTHSVRAWRTGADGARRPLTADQVLTALAAAGRVELRAIPGDSQTDFVPAEVDKGTGLRALVERLHGDRVALAVGDTGEDLPMLRMAERGVAVGNADAVLRRRAVPRTRRPYQSGVAQAVGELIGHRPGGCPACALPAPSQRRRLVLELLRAQERGRAGIAVSAARVIRLSRGHAGR